MVILTFISCAFILFALIGASVASIQIGDYWIAAGIIFAVVFALVCKLASLSGEETTA